MNKFPLISIVKVILCLLLFLLSGCAQNPKMGDDIPAESDAIDYIQYMPQNLMLDKQELNSLEVFSLTTHNRAINDAVTQQLVKDFFNQLSPLAVPVSKDEFENSWFISGLIYIAFQTTDGSYLIYGDVPSKILVRFVKGGDDQRCYGKYSVTTDTFDSFVSYIYGHSETENIDHSK